MRTYRQPILFCLFSNHRRTLQIRFTRLSKPRPGLGGLLGFPYQISIGGIMCLAARQHTGGTSVSPLLLRRPWTMTRAPRCHSPVIGRPHNRHGDPRSFRVRLESVGVGELLLPFTDVFRSPSFHPLIRLERNVCLGIFPRHLATTRSRAFTLFVLFLG
jgi:hypothetical protein